MPSAVVELTKYDIDSLVLLDGTGAVVDLDIKAYADHSFACDRLVDLYEEIAVYSGQTYNGSRRGATLPINITFATYMRSVTSADTTDAAGNPWDFTSRTNGFSGNTNAGTAGYDTDMVTVRVTMTTNSVTQQLDFAKVKLTGAWSADEPNLIQWTGVCRGGVTRT